MADPGATTQIRLGDRFEEALVYATRAHAGQSRKGAGGVPYVAHLLGVARPVVGEDRARVVELVGGRDPQHERGGGAPAVRARGEAPLRAAGRATTALLVALLCGACATAGVPTAPGTPASAAALSGPGSVAPVAPEDPAVLRAACEERARYSVDAEQVRAVMASTAIGILLGALYGAADGAYVGLLSGAGRGEGAWIGAAAGAGVGLIIGAFVGVAKAYEARSVYAATLETCLREGPPAAGIETEDEPRALAAANPSATGAGREATSTDHPRDVAE